VNRAAEPDDIVLSLLGIPCREKHALIFARWDALPVGSHFVIVNDHDPEPLYYQFAARFPGAFEWTYLVAGPDEFHIRIRRTGVMPARPPVSMPVMCGSNRPVEGQLDLRGLEPPEPMMRILSALEEFAPGVEMRAITDQRPVLLYPELEARGALYASVKLDDGSWRTRIIRG